jgi:hypothetical protein
MNILQRSMASQGILNDTQGTLADYLMSIAQISVEDAGAIYIELSSIRGNFMANIILRMIENYSLPAQYGAETEKQTSTGGKRNCK